MGAYIDKIGQKWSARHEPDASFNNAQQANNNT